MSDPGDASPPYDAMLTFNLLNSALHNGPRLGRLLLRGRTSLDTPHFVGLTSRGVIPHLSQDMLVKNTNIAGAYVALEDFVERGVSHSPLLAVRSNKSSQSALRKFIAFPSSQILILGPRRNPPVTCPAGSGDGGISIHTSNGFQHLSSEDYISAVQMLKPDIIVGLGDVASRAIASWRRLEKMTSRTEKWTKDLMQAVEDEKVDGSLFGGNIFAPVLPINQESQSWYIDSLATGLKSSVAGLAIYDTDVEFNVPEPLRTLPRLCLDNLETPHKILHGISLGLDLITIPFLGAATDAGIALDFLFPTTGRPNGFKTRRQLGVDMWLAEHATDLSPLAPGCECYACKTHHRAYIQHLLSAKEMLAWVLLQVHNYQVVDVFFTAIRNSIAQGTFDRDREMFLKTYEVELPEKTGQGPRVRGYQHRSEGAGEAKQNAQAYRVLGDSGEKFSEAPLPSLDAGAGNPGN